METIQENALKAINQNKSSLCKEQNFMIALIQLGMSDYVYS